ncbi:DNA polymerase III subunit gamma/tau [Liquorilactobacillus vini]|uniref:DNA polymerase III subunit gamma/tau n=1 Tax=Liquorilactobacillus vini TaxID=238015 RepID=UPI0002ED0208|nr:DNA polymerase III subunit gamma/tau [Liquorilactobacillus vini]
MGYRALYRVWRPQQFTDLVGQQLITQTLKNAIAAKQTSHAYLFTGPRGTGKTSAAKIFAKAINCHFQKNGEPCNQCEICRAITEGRLNDVIEIDAASNNSVDEIRDIREKVKYAPTQADYKIYIIDEVHMLSTGAFNALLKTLEEPPANVIFILATTEPYKIPATIISRTQRFDFHRINDQTLIKRMEYILKQEKVTFDPAALEVIAKAAAGGMRDALSMLDQVLSFGNHQATLKDALLVTGSVAQEQLAAYLRAVFSQQAAPAFQQIQQLLADGKDPNQLFEGLIDYCRQLLLQQTVFKDQKGESNQVLISLAKKIPTKVIYQALDILSQEQQAMRFATHQEVYLDVATVKLCQLKSNDRAATTAPAEAEITKLQTEVMTLKKQLDQLVQRSKPEEKPVHEPKKVPVTKQTKIQPNLKAIYTVLGSASRESLDELKDVWQDLMAKLSVTQRAIMNVSQPVAASQTAAVISFQYAFLFEKAVENQQLQTQLVTDLASLLGRQVKLTFLPQEQWPQIRKNYLKEYQHNKAESTKSVTKQAVSAKNSQALAAQKIWGKDAEKLVEFKDD